MLLEYEDGSTEDITQSISLTYTLSNNITFLIFDETGVAIAAADDRNGGTQLELSVSNLNITVTIVFRVVVTSSINITATPFPQYPGSSTLYVSSLGPIMNTTFWQQSQLGMFLELSDNSMIDVTQVLEGNLFEASTLSGSITVTTDNNILMVTPLNGANSSGTIIVSPILPQFHGAEKSIEAVNTPIGIIGITVASLPNNTLQGTVNSDAYRIDITLHLEDTTSIPDVLSLDAIFNTLISIETSSPAIGVTSAGYLQPLLNTASQQLITVTFDNIASDSISCFVNLVPEIGDIDIGSETEAALESVVVGDFISVPVFVNTGNEDLGNIEVILEYDESILNVADIFLGNHWSNGLYYFDIDEPGNVYFTLVFPNVGMNNERLHLLTVIFTAISSAPETTISATILTLGIQDIENKITLLSDSIAGNVPLSVLGVSNKRNIEQERHHERERREVLASGCITFPCDCAIITSGDTNNDCEFDSGDVLFLLSYLTHNVVNFSLPVGEAIRDIAEHSSSTNFDVSLDGIVDVNDVYMLFRVLIGFVPFIEEIDLIPVQSPLSDCIFSVIVTLSVESKNHFVYIDISFSNETYQTEIESDEILTGIPITYQKGEGLYGVLVRAIKQSNEVYLVQFNTTLITDIGISVIVQTLDINNQSDTAHTIQFLGPIPPIYNNTLLIDTKQLYVSAMNGYSPLQIVSNILQSDQCSNLPLIGNVLDLIFLSPYNASVIWELENERTGLSLSSLIYVQVTECLVNQMGDVVITSCQELKNVTADSNTSASLMTLPFRLYTVRAIGPTTQTNITSGVSPEDVPEGLAAPTSEVSATTVIFRWSLPQQPNGIITRYSFYVDNRILYNGSSTKYQHPVIFREAISYYLEAYNSAGFTQSSASIFDPPESTRSGDISPLGPLTFSQFIGTIVAVLCICFLLLLLVFLVPAFCRRGHPDKKKEFALLARSFSSDEIKVEEKPHLGDEYCLSDVVAVPQGRVFEELFSSDYQNKFWYKELADMELFPAMAFSISNDGDQDEALGVQQDNWNLQDHIDEEQEPDMSDLWPSDTVPLTQPVTKTTARQNVKKITKKSKKSKKQKEEDILPAGKANILSHNECSTIMEQLQRFKTSGGLQRTTSGTSDIHQEYIKGSFDTLDIRQSHSTQKERPDSQDDPPVPPTRVQSLDRTRDDSDDMWTQSDEAIFDTISRLMTTSNFEYLNEYNRLKPIRPQGTVVHGRLACNQAKNRYRNVLPADETRVCLENVASHVLGSDYINANHIHVHECCPHYISTQGPLPNTVNEFWQMVWETETTSIAMTTNPIENGRPKCEVYWPEEGTKSYSNFTVESLEKSNHEGYKKQRLLLTNTISNQQREILHLHYTGWPDFGVPIATGRFLAMLQELREQSGTLLTHCSAGIGRSGVLITVDAAIRLNQAGIYIDVPKIVSKLRQQRDGMIQSAEQYQFTYKAIADALQNIIHTPSTTTQEDPSGYTTLNRRGSGKKDGSSTLTKPKKVQIVLPPK